MSNENKFPLKVPFAEITCCGGVGLLRTGAPPAFANAQTGSTTGTAEGTQHEIGHICKREEVNCANIMQANIDSACQPDSGAGFWVPRTAPTPRPLKHSHLKKHTAVARATAGKVLASRYRHDTDVYFSVYSRGTASPAFLVNLFRTRKVPLYLTLEGHKPGSLYLYRLTREFNTM